MSSIFPAGGVSPGVTKQAYTPAIAPINGTYGYYSADCSMPLDPYALDAVISELLAFVDKQGRPWNCSSLTNLNDAIAVALTAASPPGTVAFTYALAVPTGWLPANGATYNTITYAALFAAIGTATLPDLRGVFIRGLDASRGVDSGRVRGSYQADAIGSHVHSIIIGTDTPGTGTVGFNANDANSSTGQTLDVIGVAVETRPKNVALRAIIKY